MNRIEQLEKIAMEYLKESYSKSMVASTEYYQVHKKDIMEQFIRAVQNGLEKCEIQKKAIKYIVFSVLESSILTKSYDLQIAFYDEKMYLDEEPVYSYWIPSFLFERLDDDMRAYRKQASRMVIRIQEYEIEQITKKYVINHYFQVFLLLKGMVHDVLEGQILHYPCIAEDMIVLFGRYMENLVPLYKCGGEAD